MRRSNTSGALKVSLKLAVQRLRSTTAKMEAKNKVARREIASLLEKGKEETARVVSVCGVGSLGGLTFGGTARGKHHC